MHFSKISAAVLGLSSFAAASPIAVSEGSLAAREATPAEKGLVWSPRSVKGRQLGSSLGSGSSIINLGGQSSNFQGFDKFSQFDNKFSQFNNKFGFDNNNRFGRGDQFGNGFDKFLDFCSFDNGNRFNRNNGRNIIVAQPINVILNQVVVVKQVNLINVIKKNIFLNGGRNQFRDNIRRNHFRNFNRRRNNNVNTVIVVVTEIFDISNGNRNQRFLTRQIESNPEFPNREFVVVSERDAFTVGPSDLSEASSTEGVTIPTASTTVSVPLSTGVSAAVLGARDTPEVKSWDASAPLEASSDFLLLPEGQTAPTWEGFATQSQDPASILDDNDNDSFVSLGA